MFKNKSFKAMLLALALVLSVTLVACGGGDTSTTPDPAPAPAPAPEAPAAPEPAPEPKLTIAEVALDRAMDFAAARDAGESFMKAPAAAWEDIQNGDIFVLDVRAPGDFAEAHIPGSYNVNFVGGELAGLLDRIPSDKPVYVLCYSGQTANQINGALNLAGFNSYAITGGSGNWTRAELPLEGTGDNPLADAPVVSSPASEADELAWEAAEEFIGSIVTPETRNLIAPVALYEALEANANDFYVVDIRGPKADNYDQGHIEGSYFYSWGDIANNMGQFPTDKKIVVACWSGNNAGQTVALLRMNGYDAVSLLYGINQGWMSPERTNGQELPVVTP
ncbi:rhodanese-like domain-containing protein [Desulfuribacillus alkaliarsenatis]|uniref:Rhodanese domain-containing protein n=1 Tax=Desulfuribacillus alkaliarsenatis TaxID=766136 RepID=A0A1E5G1P7_9FIRM|nr:rhodanese-like domain-containing protein [Desulfuribacillus alkaliarsenatis]OEF96752.1 hypothetical protein BHF68_06680 [Desulfuribacillus alkaliarsenatis]